MSSAETESARKMSKKVNDAILFMISIRLLVFILEFSNLIPQRLNLLFQVINIAALPGWSSTAKFTTTKESAYNKKNDHQEYYDINNAV